MFFISLSNSALTTLNITNRIALLTKMRGLQSWQFGIAEWNDQRYCSDTIMSCICQCSSHIYHHVSFNPMYVRVYVCIYIRIYVCMHACMLWDNTWRKSVLLKVTIWTIVSNMYSKHSKLITCRIAEYVSSFIGQTLKSTGWKRLRFYEVYEEVDMQPL
jgi:hypothetical protein